MHKETPKYVQIQQDKLHFWRQMHVTSNTQNDTHELEGIVHHFEEIIKTLSRQIISLEKEMCSIKKSMLVKSAFKCEEWNYNASTETVFKCHVISKHKYLSKTLKRVGRESILNDPLKFDEDIERKKGQSGYLSSQLL